MKRVIVGGPQTGKSSLAAKLAHGLPIQATDTLMAQTDWAGQGREAAKWLDAPGDAVIEGAQTARALRTWLRDNPTKRLDGVEIHHLTEPQTTLSDGQARMHKGIETVWSGIKDELKLRGAKVVGDEPR